MKAAADAAAVSNRKRRTGTGTAVSALLLLLVGAASWQIRQQRPSLSQPPSITSASSSSATSFFSSSNNLIKNNNNSSSSNHFAQAAHTAFAQIAAEEQERIQTRVVPKFDLSHWRRRTEGGLRNPDRLMLAALYAAANSVFEFGLGESTYLADFLQVPRYAGVDSDVKYVNECRQKVAATSPHFRFYYADIGDTLRWGYPKQSNLTKSVTQYQMAPLRAELLPFDVYMVDGRWRLALLVFCFLHAAGRGAERLHTMVLLHDCWQEGHSPENGKENFNRPVYHSADHLLDLIDHSGLKLCVYKRKPTTTDDELLSVWQQFYTDHE